jgi:hypothetical protein
VFSDFNYKTLSWSSSGLPKGEQRYFSERRSWEPPIDTKMDLYNNNRRRPFRCFQRTEENEKVRFCSFMTIVSSSNRIIQVLDYGYEDKRISSECGGALCVNKKISTPLPPNRVYTHKTQWQIQGDFELA